MFTAGQTLTRAINRVRRARVQPINKTNFISWAQAWAIAATERALVRGDLESADLKASRIRIHQRQSSVIIFLELKCQQQPFYPLCKIFHGGQFRGEDRQRHRHRRAVQIKRAAGFNNTARRLLSNNAVNFEPIIDVDVPRIATLSARMPGHTIDKLLRWELLKCENARSLEAEAWEGLGRGLRILDDQLRICADPAADILREQGNTSAAKEQKSESAVGCRCPVCAKARDRLNELGPAWKAWSHGDLNLANLLYDSKYGWTLIDASWVKRYLGFDLAFLVMQLELARTVPSALTRSLVAPLLDGYHHCLPDDSDWQQARLRLLLRSTNSQVARSRDYGHCRLLRDPHIEAVP